MQIPPVSTEIPQHAGWMLMGNGKQTAGQMDWRSDGWTADPKRDSSTAETKND